MEQAASPAHRSSPEFGAVDSWTQPRGAICVAVFRPDRRLLRAQLESIANQSLRDWTCHIGIDGADDDTATAVEAIVRDDPRFVVHHFEQNVGFYRNFERVLAVVEPTVAWVALADQDDYWHPRKLERLVAEFSASDVTAVSAQARLVDGDGVVLGRTHRRNPGVFGLLLDNQVTGSFAVFRSDVVQRSLPFPVPTDAAYHDHWLGLAASAIGRVVFVDEALQDYVQHGSNVLGEERGSRLRARGRQLRQRGDSGGMVRYLAEQRWGWRVAMAQAVGDRSMSGGATSGLAAAARGRMSLALLVRFMLAVLLRQAPPARAGALVVGSLGWRQGAKVPEVKPMTTQATDPHESTRRSE